FISQKAWVLTYHFIAIDDEMASLQRIKMLSRNMPFELTAEHFKRRAQKHYPEFTEKTGFDFSKLPNIKESDKSQLVKIYQAISKLAEYEPNLSKRRFISDLNAEERLSYDAKLYMKSFDVNERFLTSFKMYYLTGFWCLPTGVEVEIDRRHGISINIDESVSLANLKRHWKIIDAMKWLLIPENLGNKSYVYLERDQNIYDLSKKRMKAKEIAELHKLDEDFVRKIISRMKKRSRDT
ncbi:hypothetical protein COX25_03495, partial [bacterium (Candidatus Howlettbacteria) CG23_combo_of_CG06-09_8_20_14_all_37_9]